MMLVIAIPSAILAFALVLAVIYFAVNRHYAPPKAVGTPYWKAGHSVKGMVSIVNVEQYQAYSKGEPKLLQATDFGKVSREGLTTAEFNDQFMTMLAEAGHQASIFSAAEYAVKEIG